MKRKLILGTAFLLIACSFNSCDLKSCKFCKYVTYENGSVINSGTETEYCGADLLKQEAIPDAGTGSLITKVECR
jgi:hypothetical protein